MRRVMGMSPRKARHCVSLGKKSLPQELARERRDLSYGRPSRAAPANGIAGMARLELNSWTRHGFTSGYGLMRPG